MNRYNDNFELNQIIIERSEFPEDKQKTIKDIVY